MLDFIILLESVLQFIFGFAYVHHAAKLRIKISHCTTYFGLLGHHEGLRNWGELLCRPSYRDQCFHIHNIFKWSQQLVHTAHRTPHTRYATGMPKRQYMWHRMRNYIDFIKKYYVYESIDRSNVEGTVFPPSLNQRTWWWPGRPKLVVRWPNFKNNLILKLNNVAWWTTNKTKKLTLYFSHSQTFRWNLPLPSSGLKIKPKRISPETDLAWFLSWLTLPLRRLREYASAKRHVFF
jgi:hypothetical protein